MTDANVSDDWQPVAASGPADDWQPVPKVAARMWSEEDEFLSKPIPQAFLDRFDKGSDASKREGGLMQAIPQFTGLASTPTGRTKLWDAVSGYFGTLSRTGRFAHPTTMGDFIAGMIEPTKTPGKVAQGKTNLTTEQGLEEAIGLGALVAFGRPNKLSLTGQTSGMALRQGQVAARIERSPTGEIHDLPIGELPKAEDFANATQDLAGGEPASLRITVPVGDKLTRLWEDHGIHPAEVAHDAQTDITVKQALLSSAGDMPQRYVEAYHGSPHDFETFSLDKIGTGEGAQSYGHGLYFAENSQTAEQYRSSLSRKGAAQAEITAEATLKNSDGDRGAAIKFLQENTEWARKHRPTEDRAAENNAAIALLSDPNWKLGNTYQVRINADREHFLDWDKPLSEQSANIPQGLIDQAWEGLRNLVTYTDPMKMRGNDLYHGLIEATNSQIKPSDVLRDAGIPGIKYLDQGSRFQPPSQIVELAGGRFATQSASGKLSPSGSFATRAEAQAHLDANSPSATSNFVVFDHNLIEITHKNGEALTKQERTAAVSQMMGSQEGGAGGKPPTVTPTEAVPPSPPPPPPGSFAEAQQKVLDKISIGETGAGRKLSWDSLYTQLVDDLHPIQKAGTEAYELARLTRGQFGKATQFLEHGTFDFKTYANNDRSLREILAPVRDDLNGLRAYLTAARALEIEATGRKSGINVEAATKVADAGKEKYAGIAKEVDSYQTNVLKYLRDSGALKEASFDAMQEANKNYVPFYRLMAEVQQGGAAGKSFGPGNPVKRLKGSERDVIDPLESIVKNTYAFISVAERNDVGLKIIDALKKAGPDAEHSDIAVSTMPRDAAMDAEIADYLKANGVERPPADLISFIRTAGEDGETIGAYRDGVRETIKITDPELLAAYRGLDAQSAGILTRILAVPARTLRAGAVLTPDFMARNLLRDFITAVINSKGLFSPIDTVKGLNSLIRKDADFQNWLKSGGANATLVSLDRRYLQESLTKLTAETGLMTRAWNVVTSPLDGLRMLSELTENATRLGEFKKVAAGSLDKVDIQAAGFASREVTLDFARIGASMRAYNMITAFGNAQIQGVDRMARAFVDRPGNTMLKIAGAVTLPSVLLWFANHDDPRYQELPSWQKDLFWVVMTKDNIYRIPKPFEIGVLFGSGAERALDATLGKNPEAFDHFAKSVWGAFSPNAIPTFMSPMVEQFANRSTFTDRALIPSDMEKHLPEYQYTPYTTELTKSLGQIIAAFPGVRDASLEHDSPVLGGTTRALTSPILIENYIRAWSGGVGAYALQGADFALRKTGILPDPPKPAATLADIPFVRAFVVRYPTASAQSIQDFYDQHDKMKAYYDTWLAKAKEGDEAAVARIQQAGGPRMFVQLDGIRQTLTEHSHLVRDLYQMPGIPPEEKRQLIDQLYNSMIEIGQYGKAALKQVDAAAATVH